MKGILINYEYCTGCHSCEVACRNELGLTHGEYGIKLTEVGPYKYETEFPRDTHFEWVYNPTITKACDMCEARVAMGKMPSCVQACQAWCMYHDDVEELVKKMDGKTRWALYTAIDRNSVVSARTFEAVKKQSATTRTAAAEVEEEIVPITVGENTAVNFKISGEAKFEAFIAENATIDFEAAKEQLKETFFANEKAKVFTLAAADAKDGAEHTIKFTGVVQKYDAQGTQIGGGKAYLDRGKEIARVDINVVFM